MVVQAAADDSGPAVGTRVTTFAWDSGWARLRAVDTSDLAALPDAVDIGAASAIPVAGVTALQAIRRLGSVLGRRVLVTGASGGVGRFAVQLLSRAGAEVVAAVGSHGRGAALLELGASEVVTSLADISTPLYGVLDQVGGQYLADAFGLLAPGGLAVSIGMASGEPTTIDFEAARGRTAGSRLEPFTVTTPFGPHLEYLVGLLTGGLDPQIGWRGSWDRVAEAADALLNRQVQGKAVLDLTD